MPPTEDPLDWDCFIIAKAALAACEATGFTNVRRCADLTSVNGNWCSTSFDTGVTNSKNTFGSFKLQERLKEWIDYFIANDHIKMQSTLSVHVCKELVRGSFPGVTVFLWQ